MGYVWGWHEPMWSRLWFYHSSSPWPTLPPILKYMGDYPVKQIRSPVELTDQIFGPATQHEALQDEIYCQIMRQMTNNHNRCLICVNICTWKISAACCLHAALRRPQVELRPRLAADVAVHRPVSAESLPDETHSGLAGVTAQRAPGLGLPAEAAGDAQVGQK